METPSFDRILHAEKVLRSILRPTALVRNEWLSQTYGCDVFLKLETEQPIGSFKIRGATYCISQLSEEDRARGIIAASAGNHAQGVAWGARHFGTSALIVMPKTAPIVKFENTAALGAQIHLEGENYDEAFQAAQRIIQETGRVYVHAYKNADVIAGQATVATEILSQCPEVDFVAGSVGGGGMASGLALTLENMKPNTKLILCQAAGAPAMATSLEKHQLTDTQFRGSFADGIAVKKADSKIFEILDPRTWSTFESDEEEIAMNVLRLIEKAKIVTEGSAAIVLGALDRYSAEFRGKKVVLILSGGNLDVNLLSRIIDRGLIRSGRRLRLKVSIPDIPGALSKLTGEIARNRANVLQAIHDRSAISTRLDETSVDLTLETRGQQHAKEVVQALEEICKSVEVLR